jgi:hypothetical protein
LSTLNGLVASLAAAGGGGGSLAFAPPPISLSVSSIGCRPVLWSGYAKDYNDSVARRQPAAETR